SDPGPEGLSAEISGSHGGPGKAGGHHALYGKGGNGGMMGLVLKDILVMRKTIRTYAMFLLFYLVMTILGLFTISFTTAILQLIVMLLPMSAFSFDEMARWNGYALTFPLGRRAMVTGRYLFTLIMTLVAGLCGLI